MHKNMKILLISFSVISVILSGCVVTLYSMKESEKTKKLSFQKRLNEVTVVKEDLEKKITDAENINTELKDNIKSLEDKISTLSKQLDEGKIVITKTTARLRKKEFDIKDLNSNIETAKAEKEDMLKQLAKFNDDYLSMKSLSENLAKTKEDLEKKVKELTENNNVALGTIIIKQPSK